MNLFRKANEVRNAGARYAPGDTELVHVTPAEKAILKLLGGSGRVDPRTGLAHYYQANDSDTDSSDSDSSDSDSSDSGSNSNNSNTGGSDDDGTSNWGSNWNDPENEAYSRGATPGYGASVSSNTSGGNLALGAGGALLGAFLGNPKLATSLAKAGYNYGKGKAVSGLGDTSGWNSTSGTSSGSSSGSSSYNSSEHGSHGDGSGSYWSSLPIGTTGDLGASSGTSTGTTSTSSSTSLPSIYTDPVTGKIISNASADYESNQELLDQLMGTSLANSTLANSSTNPLLQAVNSALQARVGNDNIDNTVANTMKANDDTMARRGLGMLVSPLQDQTRASLGLSTAQARNANNLAAQEAAWKKRTDLLSFLKTGQTADTTTQLGLADLENQRKIAEATAALQEKLADKNIKYLNNVNDSNNTNAWINAAGSVLGSIDWSSLF